MLEKAMKVEILVPNRKLYAEEIEELITREEVAAIALARFLSLEISLNDYLNILETCQIDIDDYLAVVDENCAIL